MHELEQWSYKHSNYRNDEIFELRYNFENDCIDVVRCDISIPSSFVFESENQANNAVHSIGVERLIKYYFKTY